ncbi:MAG: GDSL-type esterase/lipase family protein [Candidatus Acidiferrales bacterium]
MMKPTNHALSRRGFLACLLITLFLATNSVWADDTSAGKTIRVACVGDSITYGYGLTNREQDAYPAVLGRLLGVGWDVRNFGVSATTLLHNGDYPYIKRPAYTDALTFAPDIVVIMLGTNDSKHPGDGSLEADHAVNNWQHKADYVPDYEALIASFRKANPRVKVYVCLPTPCFPGRWGINDKTIHDEIIPLIRKVAKDSNASIIDLNTPLVGKKNLFPDTVHPDPAGAKLMAETIEHALTGKEAPANAQ